jgi:hypothetical protein
MPKNPLTSRSDRECLNAFSDRDCPPAGKPPVEDWLENHWQMPSILNGNETVEVMAGDGETRIGRADEFDWGWSPIEESRITQWRRVANKFTNLSADELMTTIQRKRAEQQQHEDGLKAVKADLQTAMNELNRRLTQDCGVTLNDVMKTGNNQR